MRLLKELGNYMCPDVAGMVYDYYLPFPYPWRKDPFFKAALETREELVYGDGLVHYGKKVAWKELQEGADWAHREIQLHRENIWKIMDNHGLKIYALERNENL